MKRDDLEIYSPEASDTARGGDWQGNLLCAACLVIPLLGCVLAVYFKDTNWLILLVPLIVFMEGAFVLIPLALIVVNILIEVYR